MKIAFNKFNSFYLSNKEMIIDEAKKVLESGKYIRDINVKNIESKIAEICDRKYAVTTSSCTDALFFALKSAGISIGDEVIVPSFSYIASLSPILMCGATPVFADINLSNLTINTDNLQKIITRKTKAIIFVQLFGITIDLSKLKEITRNKNIILIEDSAQALGSVTNSKPGGKFGDISCISFDPTKIVSAFGTGGVLVTDNEEFYQKVLKLTHHGRNKDGEFDILGYNSKIPEFNASLILMQLNMLNKTVEKLNDKARLYISQLSAIENISIIKPSENQLSAYHKFVILAERRDELSNYLKKQGIETKIHYSNLLHEQPLVKVIPTVKQATPNCETAKSMALSLPIYPDLSICEIDYICNTIYNFYKS